MVDAQRPQNQRFQNQRSQSIYTLTTIPPQAVMAEVGL